MQSVSANELRLYITEAKRCLLICTLQSLYRHFWSFHTMHFRSGKRHEKLPLPLPPGRSGPPHNTSSHPSLHPKPHVDPINRFSAAHRRVCPYFTCPPKLPLPLRGSGPSPNTWFLGTTQVHNPNGISIGSAVFVALTVVSCRQTTRSTMLH